jgi:hypothetical protein
MEDRSEPLPQSGPGQRVARQVGGRRAAEQHDERAPSD